MNARMIAVLLVLAGIAPRVSAAEVGVGAAFNDGSTILIPIKTQVLLIEPEVNFQTSHSAEGGGQTVTDYAPGIGVYFRKEMGQLETYAGLRVNYEIFKQKQETPDVEFKQTSWRITPTIGLQYFLAKQFSLGVDAGFRYSTTEFKQTFTGTTTTQSQHGWDTVTRILVRAYFF